MGTERRKQRRIPVRIDTHFKSTTKAGIGHVSDLSAGGCRLTSNVPLAPGDQAVLTLYFDRDGSMTVTGRVVSIGAKGIGIKFENLSSSIQHQFREMLYSLN